MGCVISRVPIGLSFMEARNKTFLVARKLLGLHHGETKWLQAPAPVATAPCPSREDAGLGSVGGTAPPGTLSGGPRTGSPRCCPPARRPRGPRGAVPAAGSAGVRAAPVCGQRWRRGRARSPLSRPQPPPARAGRGRRGAPPGGRPGPGGARPKLILFSKPYRIKLTTANKISLHVSTVKVQNKIKLVLVKLGSSALAPFSLA
ncbi:uncharacterized protein LOC129117135 [Agelaius phoeniceus]|uniref:uncharacterized protein LOC129117135 n=1 Tax=Agelaius phoeniceus TaxID=39638 RepID=UPI0040551DAF